MSSSLTFHVIPVTPYEQNCSLLICNETQKAVVIDPGGDLDKINDVLFESKASLEKVLLTHGHWDHCGYAKEFADQHKVPLIGPHKEDAFWIEALPHLERFGMAPRPAFVPDEWLTDGQCVIFGNQSLLVLHCPGHTPGHVVYVHKASRTAWVGDVLFKGSVGRTDFPKGNEEQLMKSIERKLFPLGDDMSFVSGHGDMSTFGEEKKNKPLFKKENQTQIRFLVTIQVGGDFTPSLFFLD